MVTTSGDRVASAWLRAASGGSAAVVRPRFRGGQRASGAETARRRRQAIRRKEAGRRHHPCTTQGRVPDQQHQSPWWLRRCEEQSQRRSGKRVPRRLERRWRGAHRVKRCSCRKKCRMGSRGAGSKASTSEEEPGGTSMKDVDMIPSVAAKATASAATLASQAQQLPHLRQQQQHSGLWEEL